MKAIFSLHIIYLYWYKDMEKLRNWRIVKGISVKKAGALAGVTGIQWYRYKIGTRRVSAESLPIVARITGIPPHELRPDLADIFFSTHGRG
ncbi:MAG: putative DNA-binding protein [Candidatus Tokpelaia sp. JSC189]|nr:MAG: putative DNA-binding protein [Candidatus Tokpelaia sp. JSC189]